MIDSIERLKLSATFAIVGGNVQKLSDAGSAKLELPALAAAQLIDGKYKVIRLIGYGGMGAVYQVHHQLLQKDMALKTICSQSITDEQWKRFQREAKAIARLRHQNIVEVFDFGVAGEELPYYTMELIDGCSLSDKLAEVGALPVAEALHLFLQVAEALSHAHRQQIVHRDIKPGNILLAGAGTVRGGGTQVKIVDFGTAKLVADTSADNQFSTRQGSVCGSPLYMSPEQSMAENVDSRSDVYSFGCSLFHAIAGQPPFLGENAFVTMMMHQKDPVPQLNHVNPGCRAPQRLEGLMLRLLAKNPERRLQDFEDVKKELLVCLSAVESGVGTAGGAAAWTTRHAVDYAADTLAEAGLDTLGDDSLKKQAEKTAGRVLKGLVAIFFLLLSGLSMYFIAASGQCFPPVWLRNGISFGGISAGEGTAGSGVNKKVDPDPSGISEVEVGPDLRPVIAGKETLAGANRAYDTLEPFVVRKMKKADGNQIVFEFPPGNNGARLYFKNLKAQQCSGTVTVPAEQDYKLVLLENLRPGFIRRLPPDSVKSLKLNTREYGDWTNQDLEAISHLSGLEQLDISESNFDASCLPYISLLHNLEQLRVGETKIRADQLLGLKILPRLKEISISGLKNASSFVRGLHPDYLLHDLNATGTDLTDDDMPHLAGLKGLRHISLTHTKVTDKGLRALVSLPMLNSIALTESAIDQRSIGTLGQMRSLRDLRIDTQKWSPADRQRLKSVLPSNCTIRSNEHIYEGI